jgi:hypothetical protein
VASPKEAGVSPVSVIAVQESQAAITLRTPMPVIGDCFALLQVMKVSTARDFAADEHLTGIKPSAWRFFTGGFSK